MDLKSENLLCWSPIRVYSHGDRIFVDWCYLGDARFTEPFHDNTIEARWREPFNVLFRRQTPIEFLGEIYDQSPGIAPKGFIFHVSRCGSTLVSQMLAALEKNIVISEASIIDKLIRSDELPKEVSEDAKITRLRWIFNALAQKRFAAEENFFVKFDSWHIHYLPLIKKAFPAVPWIFMYRNPVEVIVSNLRQPGAQMIPGAIKSIFPDFDLSEILQFSTEERFARTIASFFETALADAENPNCRLINYSQLPEAVTGEICRHFAVEFTDEEIVEMQNASKFSAKTPQLTFVADGDQKRKEANEKVIGFAEKLVNPLYEKLENRRLQT